MTGLGNEPDRGCVRACVRAWGGSEKVSSFFVFLLSDLYVSSCIFCFFFSLSDSCGLDGDGGI